MINNSFGLKTFTNTSNTTISNLQANTGIFNSLTVSNLSLSVLNIQKVSETIYPIVMDAGVAVGTNLIIDFNFITSLNISISPMTYSGIPRWYNTVIFRNIPSTNNTTYTFNFIIYAPANTKTLLFNQPLINVNLSNYTNNGYLNLTITQTNISYIYQTIKIISGSTDSTTQTYSVFSTCTGI